MITVTIQVPPAAQFHKEATDLLVTLMESIEDRGHRAKVDIVPGGDITVEVKTQDGDLS